MECHLENFGGTPRPVKVHGVTREKLVLETVMMTIHMELCK